MLVLPSNSSLISVWH
uniref:Uncharacterized protein n=1 Tax=Anguilla anguilla TaxID=7936 RepID=A0A0E9QR35_ANGAN